MSRRPPVLKASSVTYRYLNSAATIRLTLAKRPRAFIKTPHGNRWFAETSEGPWLEIDLAEALNMIVGSRAYEHDDRHPVIAEINRFRREVLS